MDQVAHRADGGSLQPYLQPHQIQQMEFALGQLGAIAGLHHQFFSHQGLGGFAGIDPGEAHHKQLLAGQLAAAE